MMIVYATCFMLQASERGCQSGHINEFVFKLAAGFVHFVLVLDNGPV